MLSTLWTNHICVTGGASPTVPPPFRLHTPIILGSTQLPSKTRHSSCFSRSHLARIRQSTTEQPAPPASRTPQELLDLSSSRLDRRRCPLYSSTLSCDSQSQGYGHRASLVNQTMATYQPPNHDSTTSQPYSTSNAYNDRSRRYSRVDPQTTQPRENWTARTEASMPERTRIQPQPINEAVGSAFQSDVPPELIAQITENVLKQLKTSGIDSTATPVPPPPSQAAYPPPPPPPVQQPVPQSPSTLSGSSPPMPNRVFTPPSPHEHSDYPHHASPQSQSGVLPGTAHSPQEPRSPVREAPQSNFYDRRTSSPLSQTSESGPTRPKGPVRLSTAVGETTLEKIWGQLFDEAGHPTPRLGQFLRGLAVHIVCLPPFSDIVERYLQTRNRSRTTSHVIVSSSLQTRWFNTIRMLSCQMNSILGQVCCFRDSSKTAC